ncbi:septum formation family protein [Dactylosporangium sp. NPDC005572]|uniref:septum formation family protein n=1 Tax=Dactylosporangium sp. NPDC005572 TaxID=3156889 RepID=UPI0033BE9BCD
MRLKIAAGVAVALVLACCGFAIWRRISPTNHAFGDKGCYVGVPAEPDTLQIGKCGELHEAEIIDNFYPEGAEASCRQAAEAFLGGPLRDSRVVTRLLPYVDEEYTSQGCALVVTSDSAGTTAQHGGSLRDAMRGDRPMAITCGTADQERLVYKDCTSPHNAEYTGSAVDGGQPEVSCARLVAEYVGLTPEELRIRTDLEVRWLETGTDHIGCLAVAADERKVLSASVRGIGHAPI